MYSHRSSSHPARLSTGTTIGRGATRTRNERGGEFLVAAGAAEAVGVEQFVQGLHVMAVTNVLVATCADQLLGRRSRRGRGKGRRMRIRRRRRSGRGCHGGSIGGSGGGCDTRRRRGRSGGI